MSIWRREPSLNAKDRSTDMRVDLVDLSLFRHVVEAGSITHGADRAHLALAAASTRIRNMEASIGAVLLTIASVMAEAARVAEDNAGFV